MEDSKTAAGAEAGVPPMNQETYLKERLEDQIVWYDRKSLYNQRWFKRLQVASIFGSASIPFLTGYITETTLALKLTVGALGLAVALTTAILGLYKFQENWLEYRTTCESLKHEKYRFLTRSEPYNRRNPFRLLVDRVENLISQENTAWRQLMQKDEDGTE